MPSRNRASAAGIALVAAWLVAMFGAAGTVRWPTGWLFVGIIALGLVLHRAYVAKRNPAILKKRKRVGEGTKAWDKAWLVVFWPLMLGVPVVAAVDVVRAQGAPLPMWAWPVGAALFGVGMTTSAWAMGANPFFEGTVRIQLGQAVVGTGPYRHVRHPGYVGLILWSLGMPPLLLSRRAFLPALLAAAWVVVRTALEDATLRRELAGYEQYAARVRYRLAPGIW
jgi:protein-S-isoprenylcysteine O-methyltransferase Ste14